MNIKNIDKAIAVMRRAAEYPDNFSMGSWQVIHDPCFRPQLERFEYTEKDFHRCGNSACFAGYLALSPEFRALGLETASRPCEPVPIMTITPRGQEIDLEPANSIAYLLDVSVELMERFIFEQYLIPEIEDTFYGKIWHGITPKDVIAKLEALKIGEFGEQKFSLEGGGSLKMKIDQIMKLVKGPSSIKKVNKGVMIHIMQEFIERHVHHSSRGDLVWLVRTECERLGYDYYLSRVTSKSMPEARGFVSHNKPLSEEYNQTQDCELLFSYHHASLTSTYHGE